MNIHKQLNSSKMSTVLVSVVLIFFSACSDEKPVLLTQEDRQLVDSLFTVAKDSLQIEWSEWCAEYKRVQGPRLQDSLLQARKKEIRNQLNKLNPSLQ